jgi:hypothetical protein
MEESTLRRLMGETARSGCGQRYAAENVDVLGKFEQLWFMSVFCEECEAQYLVAAEVSGDPGPEAVTDLFPEEAERLGSLSCVNDDDVLDMRLFLGSFRGDVAELLRA